MARLISVLGLPLGARILDCPCGQGRHAFLLAEAGYDVRGADLSRHLLAAARLRLRGRAANPRFTLADMRNLPSAWTGRYDAVVNLFSSFGFFLDPADDAKVIAEFARVLTPGGLLVWHGGNRDVIPTRFPVRDWWTAPDGTLFAQEREFDHMSGVLTVRTTWRRDGGDGAREHRIRLYNATRIAEMCAAHGMVVEQGLDGDRDGDLGKRSSTMLLVARKE